MGENGKGKSLNQRETNKKKFEKIYQMRCYIVFTAKASGVSERKSTGYRKTVDRIEGTGWQRTRASWLTCSGGGISLGTGIVETHQKQKADDQKGYE